MSNPKENIVKGNKEEKDRKPNKAFQEIKMIIGNKIKLQNRGGEAVDNFQSREVSTVTLTNHILRKFSPIIDARQSKSPVIHRKQTLLKNEEQSQESSSSSPLEENSAVQAGASAKSKRCVKQIEKEKSARLAGTFSSRSVELDRHVARSGIFERHASRSDLSGPCASRSVLCSSHTFKFISYNLILKLKPIL